MKNPLFSHGDKRRLKKRVRKAARRGILSLFGGGGSRPAGHSGAGSSGVRGDVISALLNLGYKRDRAAKMTPTAARGEGFDSLFRRAMKRNPDLSDEEKRALDAFRQFHGREPDEVITLQENFIEQGNFWQLGRFVGWDMAQFPIEPFVRVAPNVNCEPAGIMLCGEPPIEEDGKLVSHQLFLKGGKQDLEWSLKEHFGITSNAQLVDLGEIINCWYFAKKKADNFRPLFYHHTFAEELPARERAGKRPRLMYDRLNKRQYVIGGDYTIPAEGIRN